MSLKNNPFYIRYQNNIGLPISDALLSKIMGSDSESRQATEFLEWFDKELQKPHERKKK